MIYESKHCACFKASVYPIPNEIAKWSFKTPSKVLEFFNNEKMSWEQSLTIGICKAQLLY